MLPIWQLPTFAVPSWIFFNVQIYEAGMKRGRLECRLGVIVEENAQVCFSGRPHFRTSFWWHL